MKQIIPHFEPVENFSEKRILIELYRRMYGPTIQCDITVETPDAAYTCGCAAVSQDVHYCPTHLKPLQPGAFNAPIQPSAPPAGERAKEWLAAQEKNLDGDWYWLSPKLLDAEFFAIRDAGRLAGWAEAANKLLSRAVEMAKSSGNPELTEIQSEEILDCATQWQEAYNAIRAAATQRKGESE